MILTVNPALCQLLGQTRETLIGHPYGELLGEDDLARARHPSSAPCRAAQARPSPSPCSAPTAASATSRPRFR
ncbi:PAS domain-containing protein [Pseudomonas aeruginosa]|nr:PAS domain-containing protein [Pseudomonas aeruginosa]